jgi:Putative auto-transporter adhesin, head GIN domain
MRITALIVAALLSASPAFAADRNYSVTTFDRVRVDGGYKVTVKTGVAPFARASGNQTALDSVSIEVQGRTLIVRRNRSSWGGYPGASTGPVQIEVGTHELNTAWVNGDGSLFIDKVKGLKFQSDVQGAGLIQIANVDADQLRVGLAGAATARLSGKALNMTAVVQGSSMLDADSLSTKDLVVTAGGPAIARANATNSAKVNGAGVASITLSGNPACTVKMTGSASVSGCD